MANQRAILEATGVIALDQFRSTYPDFFALFDGEKLAQAIHAELSFVGASEATVKDFSVSNLVRDLARLTLNLVDRKALGFPIQKFGETPEAEADIAKMRISVFGIPRGATRAKPQTAAATEPEAPVSKWANLTQAEFDRMPTRQSKALYATDLDFRAAVDKFSAADAQIKASRSDAARQRVYLYRSDISKYFVKFFAGVSQWTENLDHTVSQVTTEEAYRLLGILQSQSITAQAYSTADRQLVNVVPATKVETAPIQEPKGPWRLEPSGLTTVGSKQRRHPSGVFILRATDGSFLARIDETRNVVITVTQSGNARAFTSREAAHAAADQVNPLVLYLCRGDGLDVSK